MSGTTTTDTPTQETSIPFGRTVLILLIGSAAYILYEMYLPALTAIETSLDTSAQLVQWTITIYLLALSVSQLVLGPLADMIGRRKVLIVGMALVIIGSVICALADSIWAFLLGRAFQGLGAGANITLSKTIIRDHLVGAKLAQVTAFLGIAISVVTAISVVVGGYVVTAFGWRAIFWIIAGLFLLLDIAVFFLVRGWAPDGAPKWSDRKERRAQQIASGIPGPFKVGLLLSRDLHFMSLLLTAAMIFGGVLAYLTVTPFLYVRVFKIDPSTFGWLVVAIAAAGMAGKLMMNFLVKRLSLDWVHVLGIAFVVLGSGILLALSLLGHQTLWTVLLPFIAYSCGAGILTPVLTAKALGAIGKEHAGTASGLFGTAMTFGAVITTWIVSLTPHDTAMPLAIIASVVAIVCIILGFFTRTPKETAQT